MPRGSPCMCIRHTGTPSEAAASSAPSRRSAYTSLIMPAPAATAARITSGLEVSMEIGTAQRAASASITGSTRASSSSVDTSAAPGRVDSPPTSSMSAPCSTIARPCATAASRSPYKPPSENESGVTLRMPTTRGRSSVSGRPLQSSTVANRSAADIIGCASGQAAQGAHVLTVVAQLVDGVADVRQRRVCRILAEALAHLRRPAARQLFERRDVEVAVMEVALQPRHLPVHEAAVLADRIAAHRRLAGRDPGLEEFHRRLFGGGVIGGGIEYLLPQAGAAVLVAVPAVHGFEPVQLVADRKHRPFGQNVEILVGDDGGDLQDGIGIRVEAGHLQIDPDQVVFVGLAHASSWAAEV